ncbi:hypothetical protein NMY22_g1261 [Coprinellus aureogranulatus]|nr:hypothetical protein NMY22_g1261 [Coprinellus aureogranulatus]
MSQAGTEADVLLNDKQISWRDAVSNKGKVFRVGSLVRDESNVVSDRPADGKEVRTKTWVSHTCYVNWPVAAVGDNGWKTPDQDVIDKVDISRYTLTQSSSSIYSYILTITNTQNWDYTFYDDTGDYYSLNCFTAGDHYVQYNSDEPTIRTVTADC